MKKAPYQITRTDSEFYPGIYIFRLRDTRDSHLVLIDSHRQPVPPKSMLAIQAKLNSLAELQLVFG